MACSDDAKVHHWIRLTSGKEFSRLLYPNPVCFLSTIGGASLAAPGSTDAVTGNKDGAIENYANSREESSAATSNVMILSWLTPTNNRGRFMFSIHKGRYSATLLAPCVDVPASEEGARRYQTGVEFALSVPIKGMEQMVLNVGSVSGKFGSKFPSAKADPNDEMKDCTEMANLSNRQRKKMRRQRLMSHGVEGLVPVRLGSATPLEEDEPMSLFVVKGTVAHLRCRTYAVSGTPPADQGEDEGKTGGTGDSEKSDENGIPIIDGDHLLVMAEVIDAYVHHSYWDGEKMLFRPLSRDVPPYLTFFGSQTFGYVMTDEDAAESSLVIK